VTLPLPTVGRCGACLLVKRNCLENNNLRSNG
jgi:hypothetical protein